MSRRIETLFLDGPAGRLEALLEEPETGPPTAVALVCHPHPQGGGTMHNKVVYRLARGLRKTGSVVLRFNYRGVNLSEGAYDGGVGETEDARIALQEIHNRYPELPVAVTGFSFGSRIALRLASEEPFLDRVIAVGFPTTYPDRGYVSDVKIPKYFVHSTNDQYGPRDEMQDFFAALTEPKFLFWVEASDHFFKDNLEGYETVIEQLGKHGN